MDFTKWEIISSSECFGVNIYRIQRQTISKGLTEIKRVFDYELSNYGVTL